jgi:hypothetical protein
MKKRVYAHKKQKVILWHVVDDNSNPMVHDRLKVTYSYLRGRGKVSVARTKKVFEQDLYQEFVPTNESVTIMFAE